MAEVAIREIQDEGEVSGDPEVVAKVITSDHEATERKDSEESKGSDLEGVGGFFQRQSSNEVSPSKSCRSAHLQPFRRASILVTCYVSMRQLGTPPSWHFVSPYLQML